MGLQLSCPAFRDGATIPRRHTGDGEDLSPALVWSDPPPATREFALIVDDPDAPVAEPWVHWLIYGIPAENTGLPEGVHPVAHPPEPAGSAQGLNGWKTLGYRGPAPPKGHGTHHYHFTLFALGTPLALKPGLDKSSLRHAIEAHVLGSASYTGTYERPR
jgi:Raf kinase inhibitor-like YbhB/YbcL family protein